MAKQLTLRGQASYSTQLKMSPTSHGQSIQVIGCQIIQVQVEKDAYESFFFDLSRNEARQLAAALNAHCDIADQK